jgi:esterase
MDHETGYVQSGDVKLFYRRFKSKGSKTPLQIFHGANYYDSEDWIGVASSLARDRDVVIWDARGFGQSGWSASKDYSYDACLGDAVMLQNHFGWRNAVMMGHSIGGSYALLFASRIPERTAALVLVDHCPAAPTGKPLVSTAGQKAKVYETVEAALKDSSRAPVQPGSAAWKSFESRLQRTGAGFVTRRDPDFSNRVPDMPGWQPKCAVDDMWQELKIVKAPALVVRASQSDRFEPAAIERLARDYPQVEVAVVESGHDVAAGAPDALVDHTRRFLQARGL